MAIWIVVSGLLGSACGGDETPDIDDPPIDPATDALYFYPPVEGATLTLANSGADGSTVEVTVDQVASGADGQTVTVTETGGVAGEPVALERTFRTGLDGGLAIDVVAYGGADSRTVTAAGDGLLIPPISELESGGRFTGETLVEFTGADSSGRVDLTYTVTGRGFTSTTVPAGTVVAYVVELAVHPEPDLGGAGDASIAYWIVPGFGTVRQEVTTGAATVVSELTASSVPLPRWPALVADRGLYPRPSQSHPDDDQPGPPGRGWPFPFPTAGP